VICCFLPREHKVVQEYIKSYPELSEVEAEAAVLNFDHAQLGRQLAINWKLPIRLADAIGYHHGPQEQNSSDDFAHLINYADFISLVSFPGDKIATKKVELNQSSKEFFAVDENSIEELKTVLFSEYMKADIFMRIAGVS